MSKVTYTSASQVYGYSSAPGFYVANDAWGVGSLVEGVGYSMSLTYDPDNYASGVSFSWSLPQNVGGVYAYPHVDFETSSANVSSTQAANMVNLSASYNVSLSDPVDSSAAFDLWFNSQANGSWATTSTEVLIQVHSTFGAYSNQSFTLSDSDFTGATVHVSNSSDSGANWKFIVVTLPSDKMSGTLSISDIIKGLTLDGLMTGQEYLTSMQFGSEVQGGTGGLQINSLGYNWTATSTQVGTAGNDTFTISTPGGNDIAGNGGIDTVGYSGTYATHQIKVAGSEILVTTNNNVSTLDELQGITYIRFSDGTYDTVTGTFTATSPTPNVTEKLVSDTGSLSSDHITSNDALTGASDPNAVVHFTVDGNAIAGTATADASGLWSFTPIGLADGSHMVVATETNAAGNSGSASLSFTLDTTPPTVQINNETFSHGKVALTGTASEAGDTISVYDGSTLVGTTTSGSGGAWTFSTGSVTSGVNTFTATATDAAGNVGHSGNYALLATSQGASLVGTGNAIMVGAAASQSFVGGGGGNTMVAGSIGDNFTFKAITDSTPANHDTIVNFDHAHDQILFSGIAGINASNGVALFQGQLAGSGNLSLHAHSVAYIETGGNTEVLVNTSNAAETVSTHDVHLANMEILLTGTHLGLTATDFHVA